jgi:hypothetical protein
MNEDQDLTTSGNTIRRVAIAILQYQDKFLMQLRDDIPHYSLQALQERPIAPSHRQIMLDFLSSPECRINI